MRSSSIPRSLILVASAALSFGACATQMDPGGTGAMTPAATGTMAGSPAAAAAAGTTGGAAGKPAGVATATATAGSPAATGTAGKPAGAATAGGPATATGTAGTPAASGAAGASTAAAGTSGGAAGGAAAGGAVTFTKVHEEILTGAGCAVGACHGSVQAPSKLGLADKADAYMGLVGVKAMGSPGPGPMMMMGCAGMDFTRVVAGDPDNSLLVQKLEGKQKCGKEMPIGGMLKPEQIKLVRDWIMAGAKND